MCLMTSEGLRARPSEPRMKNFLWLSIPLMLVIGSINAISGTSWSWRQKITVIVSTPNGVRAGSSVTTARLTLKNTRIMPQSGSSYVVSGEAAMVEIVPGKYLFALLKRMPTVSEIYRVPPDQIGQKIGSTTELAQHSWPMLVTFLDLNDPRTVKEITPQNIEGIFGSGVAIDNIRFSLTNDGRTKSIDRVLSWRCELAQRGARLNGKTGTISTNELSNNIGSRAISTLPCFWLWASAESAIENIFRHR